MTGGLWSVKRRPDGRLPALPPARSALTLAKERYRLGLASIVDVTMATTALLLAEVRLSEAQYAVQATTAAVSYATGQAFQNY